MASEDFFVFLSVVFKKFGLVFNEFLPVVDGSSDKVRGNLYPNINDTR